MKLYKSQIFNFSFQTSIKSPISSGPSSESSSTSFSLKGVIIISDKALFYYFNSMIRLDLHLKFNVCKIGFDN